MELKIKPGSKNQFPTGGVLVKGATASIWVREIQSMGLDFKKIKIYPLPGDIANSVWGCFVLISTDINKSLVGKNELCQRVSSNLYIPEKSVIHPALTSEEIEKLFASGPHIIHPGFGMAELSEAVNFSEILNKPLKKQPHTKKPEPTIFIPKQVNSFQVEPVSPEEMLKQMEENIFPKKEKMKDESLNLFEKAKLSFYKMLFTKKKPTGNAPAETGSEKKELWGKIDSLLSSSWKRGGKWTKKLQDDFENLDERNRKEVEKLLDLLRKNPAEALKYAIPLDTTGSMRGGDAKRFELSKRWFDFSLFGNNMGSGSGSVNLSEHFHELSAQYSSTAQELIKQGDHKKAAFIYMKLLKNYILAAQTLESGKHYEEAASIYLKHLNDKKRAAECYEKGAMISNAIELYKELNENEKVGDLYLSVNKRQEADLFFEKAADVYSSSHQFVKASLVYKNKMNKPEAGQKALLKGWHGNMDAFNCLNNYFNNTNDIKTLRSEIHHIYSNYVSDHNKEVFLKVLRYEYLKKNELALEIKELAYEIIAAQAQVNPDIVSELKEFNPRDKELAKDTIRYKMNRKKNK